MKITHQAVEQLVAPSTVHYERYGRGRICGYANVPAGISRGDFENALEAGGCKVNRAYWPGGNSVEVTNVSSKGALLDPNREHVIGWK